MTILKHIRQLYFTGEAYAKLQAKNENGNTLRSMHWICSRIEDATFLSVWWNGEYNIYSNIVFLSFEKTINRISAT